MDFTGCRCDIVVESKLSLFTSLLHLFLIRSNNEIKKIAHDDSIDMKRMLISLTDSETILLISLKL